MLLYHICACISHIFSYKKLPSKIGVQLYMEYYVLFFLLRRTKSSEWESPRHRYCLLRNPQSCLCMQMLNPPKESWYPFYDWAHDTSIIVKPPVETSSVCAYCRQRQRSDFVATWVVTQNITLVFTPHVIFQNAYLLSWVRLLSCKLLHTRDGTNILLVYQRILITWLYLTLSVPRSSKTTSLTNYRKCW